MMNNSEITAAIKNLIEIMEKNNAASNNGIFASTVLFNDLDGNTSAHVSSEFLIDVFKEYLQLKNS